MSSSSLFPFYEWFESIFLFWSILERLWCALELLFYYKSLFNSKPESTPQDTLYQYCPCKYSLFWSFTLFYVFSISQSSKKRKTMGLFRSPCQLVLSTLRLPLLGFSEHHLFCLKSHQIRIAVNFYWSVSVLLGSWRIFLWWRWNANRKLNRVVVGRWRLTTTMRATL